MKVLLHISKWIFLAYAISIPVLILSISAINGVGEGLQFILLPPTIAFFLVLVWWTKTLLSFISVRIEPIILNENYLIIALILWLIAFVTLPMILISIFGIWNRFDRQNPIADIAKQSYVLLMASSLTTFILAIVCIIYYSQKTKKIKLGRSL